MDKILYAVAFSLLISLLSTPAMTCSNSAGNTETTGAACSIVDLNRMSKYRYAMDNSYTGPPGNLSERDLRPARKNPSDSNASGVGCSLGLCIMDTLYNEVLFRTSY